MKLAASQATARQPHTLSIAPVHSLPVQAAPGVRELFQAAAQGRHADVGHLLRLTGSPRVLVNPDDGRTPLMTALLAEDPSARARTSDLLTDNGASLSGRDGALDRDLVGWAAALGRYSELEKILSAMSSATMRTDWRKRDSQGQTCLHLAVTSGCAQTVSVLLRAMLRQRASVDHLNSQGLTAYMLARRLGFDEIAGMLRQRQRLDEEEVERAERRRARQQEQQQQQLMAGRRFRKEQQLRLPPVEMQPAAKPALLPPILTLNRGETYAEVLIKAIGKGDCRTSQQLLHSALDLWSEQHFPSYRRGVTAGAAAAAEAAAREAAAREAARAEPSAMGRRGRRSQGRRLDSRLR